MKINFRNKKGSMSIEILVAVTIVTVAVLAATAVSNKSVAIARQSTSYAQASFLLEEGAEAVRSIRDDVWTLIYDAEVGVNRYLLFSGNEWSIVTDINSSTPTGRFTRVVNFNYVNRDDTSGDIVTSGGTLDQGTRLVTIRVGWDEGGVSKSKELSFYLTDLF